MLIDRHLVHSSRLEPAGWCTHMWWPIRQIPDGAILVSSLEAMDAP
ncbi:hypothetical protein [Nocardiopsis sp. LOL_012]